MGFTNYTLSNKTFLDSQLQKGLINAKDYLDISKDSSFNNIDLSKGLANYSSKSNSSWKDLFTADNAKIASDVMSGLAGLGSAYLSYKNYGLAKDQYNTATALANTNLYNQGTLINSQLDDKAKQEAHSQGLSGAEYDAYVANAAKNHVKTSI